MRNYKLLFGIIIVISVFAFAIFNVWIFSQSSKKNNASSLETIRQSAASSDPTKRVATFPSDDGSKRIPTTIPTATPTPRPTGPGNYACSPDGACNSYSNEMRKQYCTITYADNLCLDQCKDKSKTCTK